MPIMIDGYNLLHASGVLPSRAGPATLERARAALLGFLANALAGHERKATVIVFDAAAAPPGLPDQYLHQGMTVRFARGYVNADQLIAELVREHSAPKRLTVVSSDHQVQRAARRRKAKAVDSEDWIRIRMRRRRELGLAGDGDDDAKPDRLLSEAEVKHWMEAFGEAPSPDDGER